MKTFIHSTSLAVAMTALLLSGCATRSPDDAAIDKTAVVRSVNGAVEVRTAGSGSWQPARQGDRLPVGSTVRTGDGASAVLHLGGTGPLVRLQAKSRLEIVRLSPLPGGGTETILNLPEGNAFVDDKDVRGSRVEIRTPRGVVTVPPTQR